MGRLELQNELLNYCDHVYFQPPENIKLVYPCIVYSRTNDYNIKTGDKLYVSVDLYDLTVIDRDPESTIYKEIYQDLPMCRLGRSFVADSLHHTMLHLYY